MVDDMMRYLANSKDVLKDRSRKRNAVICVTIMKFFPSKTSMLEFILVKLETEGNY